MPKIKSINPKEFWSFFSRSIPEKHAVFLTPELTGLVASTTDSLEVPPDSAKPDTLSREDVLVFLKVLVALKSSRPVKLIPSGKTKWSVHYGPKP